MDFYIDEKGEIDKEVAATSLNRLRYQNVFSRLYSIKGDWNSEKELGCNLEEYIGAFTNSEITSVESAITEGVVSNITSGDDIYIEIDNKEFEQGYFLYLKDALNSSVYKKINVEFYGYV